MTCVTLLSGVLIGIGASQAPAGSDKAAMSTFEQRAHDALMLQLTFFLGEGSTPGFECYAAHEKIHPWLKNFPDETLAALRNKDKRSRSAALTFLFQEACLVRAPVWTGDNPGDDRFRVALGQHARPVTAALEHALKEVQGEDRLHAALALLSLITDDREALNTIVDELKAPDNSRRHDACELTGIMQIGHPRVIAALSTALSDRDVNVRQAAAKAIWQIGSRASKAVPALIEYLKSGDAASVDIYALESMTTALKVGPSPLRYLDGFPYKRVLGFERRNIALLALGEMGADAAPAVPVILGRFKTADPGERLDLFTCLARLGADAKSALPTLRKYLSSDLNVERMYVAAAILCVDPDDPGAADVITSAWFGNGTEARELAFRACGELQPKVKLFEPFLTAALKNSKSRLADYALRALGNLGTFAEPAIPALAVLATDERDFGTRSEAATVLGKIGKKSIPALKRILADPQSNGRDAAVLALGQIAKNETDILPLLIRTLSDADQSVRSATGVALGRLGKIAAPAQTALTQASQHDNVPEVRAIASWALTQLTR